LALFLGLIAAHLQSKRTYISKGSKSSRVLNLKVKDNEVLLASYENEKVGGYQFAHVVPFSVNVLQGKGRETSEGYVWRMTIQSQGATALSLTFSPFHLPEGAELYVIGEKETRGAYTSVNNWKRESLTVWPVKGEWVTIEYFQPLHVKETATLELSTVAHGFRTLGFGDSGSCNNNVACDTGRWSNQIRSSGMLLSNFGSRFCSGSLVNNVNNDGRQLFLSANHCSPASGDIVMLNYQSPTCSPNVDGPTDDTIGGLENLASNTWSDFSVLEIGETIPASWNVYLSGVSGVNTAPTAMTGIHHPSGDIKKISYANKAGLPDRWFANEPGQWHWRITTWDDGTTEPGSSGSPLYDQNQRIVGQLHGGAASCSNIAYDSYGATWASWSNGLGAELDPSSTGNLLVNGSDLNALRKF